MKPDPNVLEEQDKMIDEMMDRSKEYCKDLLRDAYASGAISEESALADFKNCPALLPKAVIDIYMKRRPFEISKEMHIGWHREVRNLEKFI